MRKTFIKTLSVLARRDKRIFLLTGDLGFLVMEEFKKEFPGRFINMGVQEANMMGVATGLSLSGKKVFTYSIIPFTTARCLEQIVNDICAHNADVKLIGVGQGYSYSVQGHTHYAINDVGILQSIPNIKIISPGDPWEVMEAVKSSVKIKGPVYIRLAKVGEPILHVKPTAFKIGKGIVMKEGKDVTLIASGNMLESALKVGRALEQKGIKAGVVSMHTIKPIDKTLIKNIVKKTGFIVTLEEHSIHGGLGSAVAAVLAELPQRPLFHCFGIPDAFAKTVGSQDYMRDKAGISVPKIIKTLERLMS